MYAEVPHASASECAMSQTRTAIGCIVVPAGLSRGRRRQAWLAEPVRRESL